jgi:quercetin dioxygenase-like cupin family protein
MMDKAFLRELLDHNVVKLAKDEGSASQIANLRLIWKARGPETGYQFSIYEMVLQPGVGIPLHKHPYAEFFMVLEGEMSFARLCEDEAVEWIKCSTGDSVTAPANAPHTFHNTSTQIARFLSVSTYYHETMFISGAVSVDADAPPPAELPPDEFEKFVTASEQAQVFVVTP